MKCCCHIGMQDCYKQTLLNQAVLKFIFLKYDDLSMRNFFICNHEVFNIPNFGMYCTILLILII